MDTRVILFHKQSTSARTRFLRFDGSSSICAFEPLPANAILRDRGAVDDAPLHPGAAVSAAERELGLDRGGLEAEAEFSAVAEADGEPIPVFLVRFTATDPPFDLAEAHRGTFIDLTQARGLPEIELALLRRAYEAVLGG